MDALSLQIFGAKPTLGSKKLLSPSSIGYPGGKIRQEAEMDELP